MPISYMQRRESGIYEFRKRLPADLAGKAAPADVAEAFPKLVNAKTGCFKRELVQSLATNNPAAARKADLKAASTTIEMIEAAQRMLKAGSTTKPPPAPAQLDLGELQAEARAFWLKQDQEERESGDGRRAHQTLEERNALGPDLTPVHEGLPWGMLGDHFDIYGSQVAKDAEMFSKANARRDFSIVEASLRTALRKRGLPINPLSTEYRDAGLAILRGTKEAHDLIERRQSGEDIPTPKLALAANRGPKLSEAHLAWQQGGGAAGSKKPGRRAVMEAEPAIRRFIELHGDMRLGEITKEHARAFQRALSRLPKRIPNDLRRLSLPKLLARDLSPFERRDAATVNKMLNIVAAIVSRAKRDGGLDKVLGYVNPFDRDVKLIVDRRAKQEREVFSQADLTAIFGTSVFLAGERPRAGGGEAAFWLPLIGLLSGMRLDEIAGLRLCDLRQDGDSGEWIFDVRPHGHREVKNVTSIRLVLVHPELVRLGLLSYREAIASTGKKADASLWPIISSAPGRTLSASWSQWFGRFLRLKAGIKDPRKVFHSFRHTFKQMARGAGVTEEIHDAMTGHANSSVGRSYGGVSLKKLAEDMQKIPVPAAVAALAL